MFHKIAEFIRGGFRLSLTRHGVLLELVGGSQ